MRAFTHNPGDSMMLAVRSSPGWKVTVKQSSCPLRANLQVMLSLLKRTAAASQPASQPELLRQSSWRILAIVLSHFERLRHTAPSSCPETQLTALEVLFGAWPYVTRQDCIVPRRFGYGSLLRGLSRYQSFLSDGDSTTL